MPSAIPAYPSPAYDVATTQATSKGRAPEVEIPDATSDYTDEFGDLFLAAVTGAHAPIEKTPAGLDERGTSVTSQTLSPTEDVPGVVSMDEYGKAPTSGDPTDSFDPTWIDDVNGTSGGNQPLYAAYVAEAPVVAVATKAVVEPSQTGESRFVTAAQDRVTSQSRFGQEFFAAPGSSSELLEARSGLPTPTQQIIRTGNEAPDSQLTTESPVSATPAPFLSATESRALRPGRDGPAAIRASADASASGSEMEPEALGLTQALDLQPLHDLTNRGGRLRTSTSSGTAPENGLSNMSGPAAAAVFHTLTDEMTDTDDVAPRMAGPIGPQVQHAGLSVETVFGMQLAAEDVGGPASAFGESYAEAAPPAIARQLAPSLVSHADLSTKDKETQFEMHLDPPELGRVTVHLRQSEAGLRAHIIVAREATVPVLERELPVLQATLENAGVTVEGFDVSHHHGGGHTEDDRDVLFPVGDDDNKTVPAMARPTAETDWIGAGRVDLQA